MYEENTLFWVHSAIPNRPTQALAFYHTKNTVLIFSWGIQAEEVASGPP